MQVEEIFIAGLKIIQPQVFYDDRGFFYESYNYEKYASHGIDIDFLQDNLSKSQKNVLRGLHFQNHPHAQGKLVQVIQGSVLDVAVDIRKKSETYGQHYSLILSEENKTQLYIPPGFAHGFLTLEDNTLFSYKCTDVYHKETEGSIRWDDPELNIDWNCSQPIISEKDLIAPLFNNHQSSF